MTEGPHPPQWGPQPPDRGQPPRPQRGQPSPRYPPMYNYPPNSLPPRKPWWAKWWVWTIAGTTVFVIILATIAVNSATKSSTGNTTSSTQDEWFAAVCAQGTFHDGSSGLPNADAGAFCESKTRHGVIRIGQYQSAYVARNDVAMLSRFGGISSASMVTSSGTTEVFVCMNDRTGASLEPLAQFGFVVTPPSR